MKQQVKTYVIKSGKYYKIGRTSNLKTRLKIFATTNPDFKLIRLIDGDVEKILHSLLEDKRVKGEWFKLIQEDIDFIDEYMELLDILIFTPRF